MKIQIRFGTKNYLRGQKAIRLAFPAVSPLIIGRNFPPETFFARRHPESSTSRCRCPTSCLSSILVEGSRAKIEVTAGKFAGHDSVNAPFFEPLAWHPFTVTFRPPWTRSDRSKDSKLRPKCTRGKPPRWKSLSLVASEIPQWHDPTLLWKYKGVAACHSALPCDLLLSSVWWIFIRVACKALRIVIPL